MLNNIIKQDVVNYQVEIERHLLVEDLKAKELDRRINSPHFRSNGEGEIVLDQTKSSTAVPQDTSTWSRFLS